MELINNTNTKNKIQEPEIEESRKNKTTIKDSENEEYVKVTVSKKAEKTVMDLLYKVNDGFEGGRVSRQDLVSWILSKFVDDCTDQDIRAIRADHFDEIALLEISLKKFKQVGSLPPELKKLLLAQAGIDDTAKPKRTKSS